MELYYYKATITDIYNSRTAITADIELGFGVYKENVKLRLESIISKENKVLVPTSMEELKELLLDKEVIIHSKSHCVDDRWLCDIILGDCGHLYNYNANIISVYDGDTVTANFDLGFYTKFTEKKIRLYGINTPELRGESREAGLISRDWLRERVLHKLIQVKTFKDSTGKYGRYLGELFVKDENLNQLLLENNLAKPY